jgi:hypothetical protein
MPEDPHFTEAEKQAVVSAMKEFGNCQCKQVVADPETHRLKTIEVCDGHRFLAETDGPQSLARLHRLLYVRRTRHRWIENEYVGRCKGCGDAAAQFGVGSAKQCIRCELNAAPTAPEPAAPVDSPALPW